MSKSLKNPILWLLLLSFGGLALVFGPFLFQPNAQIFGGNGDAAKNYYTPAYYLKYDSGLHFSGMNHPNGEHIVYTDNQPALSLILNFIDDHLFPVHNNIVGILNLLMMLSIPFTALCLYGILRHYGLPKWYAVAVGLVLAFLSPQVNRMMGHYALAYGCFIPLVWLLALKMKPPSKRWKNGLLLLLTLVFFGLVHLYYLLIGCMLLAVQAVVSWLTKAEERPLLLARFAVSVLSFGLVYAFLSLTDGQADRPAAPYGFTTYRASFNSVFLPNSSPFIEIWKFFLKIRQNRWEGNAFVGLPGLIAFVFLIWRLVRKVYIRRRLAKGFRFPAIALPGKLGSWLLTAFLVLVFAMAVPFQWGLDQLLDYLGPLKQFRSPGRFAWTFYYIWTVSAAVMAWQFFRSQKTVAYTTRFVLIAMLFWWGLEGAANVKNVRNYLNIAAQPNVFRTSADEWTPWLTEQGYSSSDFEAIVSFPYFHMGSEKIYYERGAAFFGKAMEASYATGLPLQQSMLSRTSVSESLRAIGMISDPLLRHVNWSLDERGDQRKAQYLLLAPAEAVLPNSNQLTTRERQLIEMARPIGTLNSAKAYVLEERVLNAEAELKARLVDSMRVSFTSTKKSSHYGAELMSEQFTAKAWPVRSNKTEGYSFFRAFDEEGAIDGGLIGKMGYLKKGDWTLFNQAIEAPAGTEFEFSLWMRAFKEVASFPSIRFRQYDDAKNVWLEQEAFNGKTSTESFGEWVRVAYFFELREGCNRVEIIAQGNSIGLDNLLIRELGMDIEFSGQQAEMQQDGSEKSEDAYGRQYFFNNWPVLPL